MKETSMASPFFAKTTLLLVCILGCIVASPSVHAQMYIDKAVEDVAKRQGFAEELESKRRKWAQLQVAPSKIELKTLSGGKTLLAPYCTLDLGEQAPKTEWMVSKTPPMFIATIKDAGSIIFTILPPQGPDESAKFFYDSVVEKIRSDMKLRDASPLRKLTTTQFEGTISAEHSNGNKLEMYLRIVHQPEFVMMVQGLSTIPGKENVLKRIIDTISFDPEEITAESSPPESKAFIAYGKSRLIITNPKGLIRGTEDFPAMIAEMDSQSPVKVNEVFVLPAATEFSRQVNGLYRNADARSTGSMTLAEFNQVREEVEAAADQKLAITSEAVLTGVVQLEAPNMACYTHKFQIPTMTRIGITALYFHDGHVFQFCIHSDAKSDADEAWVKETMKDWIQSIRQANSTKSVASK